MRKLIALLIIVIFLVPITGCATFGSNQSYLNYIKAKEYQMTQVRKPLLDLTLTEDGRIASIKMYPQPVPIRIEQENPHPIWAVAGGALKMIGVVGSIMATGDAISDIMSAGTGNTSTINSFNENNKNKGEINLDADYSDMKTDVLDTDLTTGD